MWRLWDGFDLSICLCVMLGAEAFSVQCFEEVYYLKVLEHLFAGNLTWPCLSSLQERTD